MQTIEIRNFYDAALTGLRFVDSRQSGGRRFGKDADLRWGSFKGHLFDVDRIDLLIRDADAQWPGSMGARRVFNLLTVAEDESFGKDWEPMDTVAGAELWRDSLASPAPDNLAAALTRIASVWGMTLSPFAVDAIAPATRVVATGPSAVAALAQVFEGRADLNWADQVAVVATAPGPRQLAAFCGAALNVTKEPVFLAANESHAKAQLKGRTLVHSPDASSADQAWASELV